MATIKQGIEFEKMFSLLSSISGEDAQECLKMSHAEWLKSPQEENSEESLEHFLREHNMNEKNTKAFISQMTIQDKVIFLCLEKYLEKEGFYGMIITERLRNVGEDEYPYDPIIFYNFSVTHEPNVSHVIKKLEAA